MNINPEKNPKLRAFLYVVGVGGTIHLIALLIYSISVGDLSYFHPAHAVDIDRLWQNVSEGWFTFILGWAIFGGLIYFVYRLISVPKK